MVDAHVEEPAVVVPHRTRWQKFTDEAGFRGDFSHLNLTDPFHMKKNAVTWRTEMRAGMVTFLTMVYIVPVNASILKDVIGSGTPFTAGYVPYTQDLIVSTAAATGIACILMGLMSNFPFALAPGMGTNAFFAYTVVLKFQVPWQTALAAIWIAGFVFAFLSITGVRTYMVKIMPSCIRLSMACGIGLFLAFIGLKDIGLIVGNSATLVSLNTPLGETNTDYQKIWLGIVVLFIMGTLIARGVPGAILIGILIGTFTCWIDGKVTGFDIHGTRDPLHITNPSHFCYPLGTIDESGSRIYAASVAAVNFSATSGPRGSFPSQNGGKDYGLYFYGAVGPVVVGAASGGCTSGSFIKFPTKGVQAASCPNICGKLSFKAMGTGAWAGAFLTFVYTDILDNTGTFFAVAKIGGFMDPVTLELPRARANMAYLSDAMSTIIGSSLGVSTVVTYIESATGVRDGGRTGLVSVFVGVFFLLCLPFAPWLSQVPDLSAGPALICVGVFMMEGVKGINWDSMEDALPAFLTLIMMPLTYNIPYGIVAGCGAYLAGQVGLAPFRLYHGEDPLMRFKKMLADDLTDGLSHHELEDIKNKHLEESQRVADFHAKLNDKELP